MLQVNVHYDHKIDYSGWKNDFDSKMEKSF